MSKKIEDSSHLFEELKDSLTYTATMQASAARDAFISKIDTQAKNSKRDSAKKTLESQVNNYVIHTITEEQKGQYSSIGSVVQPGQIEIIDNRTDDYRYSSGPKTNHFNLEDQRDSIQSNLDLIKIDNMKYATNEDSTQGVKNTRSNMRSYFKSNKKALANLDPEKFKSVPLTQKIIDVNIQDQYHTLDGKINLTEYETKVKDWNNTGMITCPDVNESLHNFKDSQMFNNENNEDFMTVSAKQSIFLKKTSEDKQIVNISIPEPFSQDASGFTIRTNQLKTKEIQSLLTGVIAKPNQESHSDTSSQGVKSKNSKCRTMTTSGSVDESSKLVNNLKSKEEDP